MTYRRIVYGVLKALNEAFDDANITVNQVLYWTVFKANALRIDQYSKTESGLFLSTFSSVSVQRDNKGKYYFDLPAIVMDLPNEAGIAYIAYNIDSGCCCDGEQTFFQPTHLDKKDRLYGDEYEKPSPSNPYFYRIGDKKDNVKVDRVYLLGVECIEIRDVEVALRTNIDLSKICSLDDVIPLPAEREDDLHTAVLNLGRFVMMMPNEMINDGSGGINTVRWKSLPSEAPATPDQPQTTE